MTPEERAAARTAFAAAHGFDLSKNAVFQATAEVMDGAMRASAEVMDKEALAHAKGNGVRLLMVGHSYVAPGVRTLPVIAMAAGFDGHHQRAHTSGGSTGSANSIWLTEFGKFQEKPATPILIPAIATGQWDVMSWGAYFNDTPQSYTQWIDVCLKRNPNMKFLIQDGWTHYPRDLSHSTPEASVKAMESNFAKGQAMLIETLYDDLNDRYPGKVHVLPTGRTLLEMVHHYVAGRLPGFDCLTEDLGGTRGIYSDGGHLSSASGMDQIVGYVYFGMLYRQSPERVAGYKASNVNPTVDSLMRKAAWNAIIHSPMSGITDKGGRGVAD